MASSSNNCGKLRGIVTFLVIVFIIYSVFGNFIDEIAESVLDGGDTPPPEEKIIDIAEEYYLANPTTDEPETLSSSTIQWKYKYKWWQATWKAPNDVLNKAFTELRELENLVYNGTQYPWVENKYYRILIDDTVSVNEFWEAVYQVVRDANEERVEKISDIFRYAKNKYNLSRSEILDMVITFTQYIDYLIPKDTIFEITPPINTIIKNKGDCDTKSLLLGMILEDLGFDALILYSYHYLHAVAAVDMGRGVHKVYKNKNYYTIETTATGWKVGMIPSEVDDMDYWYPIDL
jgi:hypothetical protein